MLNIIHQRNTLESQFSYHFWMACYKDYMTVSRGNQKIESRLQFWYQATFKIVMQKLSVPSTAFTQMTCHTPLISTKNPVMEVLKNQSQTLLRWSTSMFPNITRIQTILLTTDSTSATVERENSSLREIKTDFCNSMTEDQFNALILMYVRRDVKLDMEKIIDRYAAKYPR